MNAILNVYEGCESDEPVKSFTCKRLTFQVGTKLEILGDKVAKLEAKKKGATAEEIDKINEEQLELTIETLQTIFPTFTKEDFNGVDPIEYQMFVREISVENARIINRAAKN